jgi:hypothetical protein
MSVGLRGEGERSQAVDGGYQPVGIANANILGLRGCVGGRWTLDTVSFPRMMVNGAPAILTVWSSMSPEGVGGDPEDVGEVVVELEEEGVSGVVGVGAEDP